MTVLIQYDIKGNPLSKFQLEKVNKTTVTYAATVSPSFSFRICIPQTIANSLSEDESYPQEICLLACLPDKLPPSFRCAVG